MGREARGRSPPAVAKSGAKVAIGHRRTLPERDGGVSLRRGFAAARPALPPELLVEVVPEKGRPDIREVFLRTYRIVYRVREDGIVVLTVGASPVPARRSGG